MSFILHGFVLDEVMGDIVSCLIQMNKWSHVQYIIESREKIPRLST